MKEQRDLVQGLLRKAESDLNALEGVLSTGAMDAACFHAQQAAEKFLKAFLTFSKTEYPFTHNLSKLVELCVGRDPSFQSLMALVEPLTPYAVELRYDHDFWPSGDTADEARHAALAVKRFVLERLPPEWTLGG